MIFQHVMLPQLHFNFGPTAFDRFYQFSLPLIPGSVFVGGLVMTHPNFKARLETVFGSGAHAGLIAVGLGVYVAGLILFGLSAMLTGTVSGIAQGVTSLVEAIGQPLKAAKDRLTHDQLWEEWYRVLQDYLLRDVPVISSDLLFTWVALGATGWAGVGLCFVTPYVRHWPLYMLAAVFISFGALAPFLMIVSYLGSERLSYWDFTARLLAEIHKREPNIDQSLSSSQETSLGRKLLDTLFGRTKSG
jgi:hypothetical protein